MYSPRKIRPASCVLAVLLFCRPGFAGRPLAIDDAEPVAPRQFEFEAGIGYVGNHQIEHFDFPFGLTYGLMPRLEAGIGFGGQIEERKETLGEERAVTDVGDLTLGAKAKVLTVDRFWADLSLACTVKLPTARRDKGMGTGRTDFDLTWIVTKPIAEKWNGHFNVGYTWTGNHSDETHDDILHYGVALDYQLTETVQVVAEVFASTPLTAEGETTVRVNGGVRWQAWDAVVFDAAVGTGLYQDAAEITVTVGLTWAFGFGK